MATVTIDTNPLTQSQADAILHNATNLPLQDIAQFTVWTWSDGLLYLFLYYDGTIKPTEPIYNNDAYIVIYNAVVPYNLQRVVISYDPDDPSTLWELTMKDLNSGNYVNRFDYNYGDIEPTGSRVSTLSYKLTLDQFHYGDPSRNNDFTEQFGASPAYSVKFPLFGDQGAPQCVQPDVPAPPAKEE